MKELYYTPTPEDFRRGFEFEVLYLYGGWGKEVFDDPNDIKRYGSIGQLIHALEGQQWEDHIRVPYLTAEQIEAEGFIISKHNEDELNFKNYLKMVNDTTSMIEFYYYIKDSYSIKEKSLFIYRGKGGYNDSGPDMKTIYEGSCRCINDFRLICKLLNIK